MFFTGKIIRFNLRDRRTRIYYTLHSRYTDSIYTYILPCVRQYLSGPSVTMYKRAALAGRRSVIRADREGKR